ncbi:hypothetical protein VTK73DRAFT_978 [Phialemonium thermophilum]|uniref:Uncharacterized protein n=1 Tax=Phialemonium thermophilum TaxID=223376 RepID=A0ABR3XCT3_9PEZI
MQPDYAWHSPDPKQLSQLISSWLDGVSCGVGHEDLAFVGPDLDFPCNPLRDGTGHSHGLQSPSSQFKPMSSRQTRAVSPSERRKVASSLLDEEEAASLPMRPAATSPGPSAPTSHDTPPTTVSPIDEYIASAQSPIPTPSLSARRVLGRHGSAPVLPPPPL